MSKKSIIYVTTDGAIFNGGNRNGSGRAVGGIGVVFSTDPDDFHSIFDRMAHPYAGPTHGNMEEIVTNNRMELSAVCCSLEYLIDNFEDLRKWRIILRSDSQYVIKSINEYLERWKDNGWKNSSKQAVKNKDLWERFVKIRDRFIKEMIEVIFVHLKGHNGHAIQEESDRLATKSVKDNMHLK